MLTSPALKHNQLKYPEVSFPYDFAALLVRRISANSRSKSLCAQCLCARGELRGPLVVDGSRNWLNIIACK